MLWILATLFFSGTSVILFVGWLKAEIRLHTAKQQTQKAMMIANQWHNAANTWRKIAVEFTKLSSRQSNTFSVFRTAIDEMAKLHESISKLTPEGRHEDQTQPDTDQSCSGSKPSL